MKLSFITKILLDGKGDWQAWCPIFSCTVVSVQGGKSWIQHHGWYLYPKLLLAATDKPVKSNGHYVSSQYRTQRPTASTPLRNSHLQQQGISAFMWNIKWSSVNKMRVKMGVWSSCLDGLHSPEWGRSEVPQILCLSFNEIRPRGRKT